MAKEVRMVTVDWAPFYSSELKEDGVVTVIAKEAFKRAGYDASIRFVPWRRALSLVESGEYDAVMGAYYNDERAQKYIYSEPMFDVEVGLVTLNSLGITQYKNLRELSPYKIGVSLGWANGDEFDRASYLDKQEASNQILNVRKLFRGRVDMIAIAYAVFRHEAMTMYPDKIGDAVYLNPPLMVAPLYIMASRNIENGHTLMDDFNQGLQQLKQDGSYKQILSRFGYDQF